MFNGESDDENITLDECCAILFVNVPNMLVMIFWQFSSVVIFVDHSS